MTMRFSGNRSFSALLCLSILSIPVAAAAQKYNVLDLGSGMVATDLNNRLEVVGYAPTTRQAYVWSPSGVQSLGPVEADAGLFINNSGIVVGLRLVNGRRHPFAWVNGSPVALPAPADDEIRAIRGLTDNGIVLMESTQRSWGIYNGVLYDLTAVTGTHITAVNELGMLGGWGAGTAYLRYFDGRIAAPPGWVVEAIGPAGHFAATRNLEPYSATGYYGLPDGTVTTFVSDTGRFGVEAPSSAEIVIHWASIRVTDINRAGDVVGGLSGTPFVYRNRTFGSLPSLMNDSSLLPVSANAINDSGAIAGIGWRETDRQMHAVVLIPEPPAVPTGLTFAVSAGVVSLAWQPVAGAADYVVEAGSIPGASDLYNAPIGSSPFLATPAPPGRYYVRVRARNSSGVSRPSVEVVIDVR